MNVWCLWEQLKDLVFISHNLVGKDVLSTSIAQIMTWLAFGERKALVEAEVVTSVSLVWEKWLCSSPFPRWCWSASWRRTWCTPRRTRPSTTGKWTTGSLGSLFKAPPTLEPLTEAWGKPLRTSLKVPGRVETWSVFKARRWGDVRVEYRPLGLEVSLVLPSVPGKLTSESCVSPFLQERRDLSLRTLSSPLIWSAGISPVSCCVGMTAFLIGCAFVLGTATAQARLYV